MDLPDTPAQKEAREAYRVACERLANASVVFHRAKKERAEAMDQYNEAVGAARAVGAIK